LKKRTKKLLFASVHTELSGILCAGRGV